MQGPAVPTFPVPAIVVHTTVNRWQYWHCCRLQFVRRYDAKSIHQLVLFELKGRNDKSVAKMPTSSSKYEVRLANSNLGGGFTLVLTRSPEKKGIVLEVAWINVLWKISGYVIDQIIELWFIVWLYVSSQLWMSIIRLTPQTIIHHLRSILRN